MFGCLTKTIYQEKLTKKTYRYSWAKEIGECSINANFSS